MAITPRASRPHSPNYRIVDADAGLGLLPWTFAEERLRAARIYFLSTVRADGRPHVMVIWGLWMDDEFWFSTGRQSVKGRNLAANPHCVVTPEGGEEAIIVEGVARELPEGSSHPGFAPAYKEKYGWDGSGNKEPVFVVAPRVVFGMVEKTFTQSATRWLFQ